MPYEWLTDDRTAPADAGAVLPLAELHLWPYRSLPKRGFVLFIGATAAMVALPLVMVVGSPVLWGILPFFVLTIGLVWWALNRSYADGTIIEELRLWPDRMTLTRHGPRAARHFWEANPHWVRVTLHSTGGPVPQYLTLKGGGREVELGAFLSEDERVALRTELTDLLARSGPLR